MASIMRAFALLTFLSASAISAQQLLVFGTNDLPSCANQCQLLLQAQSACVPPAAPVTSDTIYESCFCQSGYLTQLKTDPSAVCGSVCSGTDLTQVGTWYTNNCADGGASAAAVLSTASSTTKAASSTSAAVTASASATATEGATTGNSGQSSSTAVTTSTGGSWWSNHWKWIVMLIVIFLGLAILAALGIWLRRRHLRKQDQISTSFNQGITTRSTNTAMAMAPESVPATPYGSGAGRADNRFASMGTLGRARERDREMMGSQIPQTPVRGGTPVGDLERAQGQPQTPSRGRGLLSKGKGRATGEDEIGQAR